MKFVVITCVFMTGVYFGLRAERGGELESVVETIAAFIADRAETWR